MTGRLGPEEGHDELKPFPNPIQNQTQIKLRIVKNEMYSIQYQKNLRFDAFNNIL